MQCNSPRRQLLHITQCQGTRSQLEDWNCTVHSSGRLGEAKFLSLEAFLGMANRKTS